MCILFQHTTYITLPNILFTKVPIIHSRAVNSCLDHVPILSVRHPITRVTGPPPHHPPNGVPQYRQIYRESIYLTYNLVMAVNSGSGHDQTRPSPSLVTTHIEYRRGTGRQRPAGTWGFNGGVLHNAVNLSDCLLVGYFACVSRFSATRYDFRPCSPFCASVCNAYESFYLWYFCLVVSCMSVCMLACLFVFICVSLTVGSLPVCISESLSA